MEKRKVKTIDMGAPNQRWCLADHHAAYRSGHTISLGPLLQCLPQQDAAPLAAALSVERVLNRPI